MAVNDVVEAASASPDVLLRLSSTRISSLLFELAIGDRETGIASGESWFYRLKPYPTRDGGHYTGRGHCLAKCSSLRVGRLASSMEDAMDWRSDGAMEWWITWSVSKGKVLLSYVTDHWCRSWLLSRFWGRETQEKRMMKNISTSYREILMYLLPPPRLLYVTLQVQTKNNFHQRWKNQSKILHISIFFMHSWCLQMMTEKKSIQNLSLFARYIH